MAQKSLEIIRTLPHHLRHICDSWLIEGELCLYYADFMKLPTIKFIARTGIEFIQHSKSKQQGSPLKTNSKRYRAGQAAVRGIGWSSGLIVPAQFGVQ